MFICLPQSMFNILLYTWACSQALHKWLSVYIMVWYSFDNLVSMCFFGWSHLYIILWYRWACSEALHKWLSVSRWSGLTAAAKAWGMWGMATSKNRRCVICISERKILKWNRATEKSFPKESTVRDGTHTSKNRWKADDAWFAFLRKNLIRKTIGKCFKIKCIGWYQEREDGK